MPLCSCRAPLLYATYVGRYDAEQAAPDPETGGQHWVSEALLRRADDADADARLKRDLHRMEAQEFDSESDERVDDGAASGVQDVEGDEAHLGTHMDRLVELRELMVARFLGGMDAGIDYSIVDADAALDAAWEKVRDQDREDQYFDRDD